MCCAIRSAARSPSEATIASATQRCSRSALLPRPRRRPWRARSSENMSRRSLPQTRHATIVLRPFHDGEVEVPVGPTRWIGVGGVPAHRSLVFVKHGDEVAFPRHAHARCSETGGKRLKRLANLVEAPHPGGVEPDNTGAEVRLRLNEAARGEAANGLAHGTTADRECLGNLDLVQPVSSSKAAGQNERADVLSDMVGKKTALASGLRCGRCGRATVSQSAIKCRHLSFAPRLSYRLTVNSVKGSSVVTLTLMAQSVDSSCRSVYSWGVLVPPNIGMPRGTARRRHASRRNRQAPARSLL